MAATGDFYEEDEPVDEVLAAFQAGEKGLTGKVMPAKFQWSHTRVRHERARTSEPFDVHRPLYGVSRDGGNVH